MKLPAAVKAVAFLAAHPALAAVFRELLGELRKECHRLANHSWTRRKGPMAAYWMAAGAYVGHCMRLIRPGVKAAPLAPSDAVLDALEGAVRGCRMWHDEPSGPAWLLDLSDHPYVGPAVAILRANGRPG